jgi:predicted TIM-barrel fold metal-dependent hydrolase
LAWFPKDPAVAAAFCRTQNAMMADYSSHFPDRLKWAGLIPWQDADEAVMELHRSHEMGNVGVNMKATPVLGRECFDTYYDPVYAELERLGMPIIIHDTKFWSMGVERSADNFFYSHMVGRVLDGMVFLMAIICGGVLERFPRLKVVLLEGGASHMPWWLGRMDEHYEKLPHLVPWLQMEPSEYFKRQVYVGCESFEDPHFEMAIEVLGDDNFVLATDNPHWDSAPPGEVTKPVFESTRLSEATKRKVLGGNAASLIQV